MKIIHKKSRNYVYVWYSYIYIYATDICIGYCTQFYIPQTTNMMFGRLRGNFSPKLPKTCRALHPHCSGHLEFRWLFSYHRRWWNQGTCGPPIRMKHLPGSFATPSLSCIRTFNRRFGGSFQVKVQRDLGTHGFPWRNSRIPGLCFGLGPRPQKNILVGITWYLARIERFSEEFSKMKLESFFQTTNKSRPGSFLLKWRKNEPPACPHTKILNLKQLW